MVPKCVTPWYSSLSGLLNTQHFRSSVRPDQAYASLLHDCVKQGR